MGLRDEFKSMRSGGGAPKVEESTESTPVQNTQAEPAEQGEVEEGFQNPFQDGQTLGDVAEGEDGEPPVIPPPKPEAKKVAVKINGKSFETIEEAAEYAAELERTLEKKEAFEKGLEAAKPKQEVAPEPKKIKKIADKLFEDPDAAMEMLEAHVSELALKLIEDRDNQKTQAKNQEETARETWNSFYKNNSDLSDWQDEVKLVTDREWHRIKDLPVKEGLEEIAKMSRQYVASVKERALPKTTLPSKTAVTASGGNKTTTATGNTATQKKLSFADQVRSTNRRTASQSEV